MPPAAVLSTEEMISSLKFPEDGGASAWLEPALREATPDQGSANAAWDGISMGARLKILGRARVLLAERAEGFADVISSDLQRSRADTLVSEVLPLLAAIQFLERNAARVLATRYVGASGRPLWLGRVTSEVDRVPLGRVLVIAVSNYPLLLPGVQVVQALASGNTVIWKPGRGGAAVARKFAEILTEAGLPEKVLVVTDESVAAACAAIDAGIDKIFFTGSAAAGREVLQRAGARLIPCVVELSGADAAIVLPSAPIERATQAIGFGLRLNGSATCMAPRRVLLVDRMGERRLQFLAALWSELQSISPVWVPEAQARLASELLEDARRQGGTVLGGQMDEAGRFVPALVVDGRSSMRVAKTDLFAPVLTVVDVRGTDGVLKAQAECPLALTASIFCGGSGPDEAEARSLAKQLKVGHVTLNDLIVPTADPRVPFTGRKQSGFGSTRGAEGLLEMTVPRVIAVRRGASARRYEVTGAAHVGLFAGMAALLYGGHVLSRLRAVPRIVRSARAVAQASEFERSGEA